MEFVAEQMAFVGGLRIRAMFGGYGIYQDDCMFALIADDRLYFKADATTRAEFEAKGLSPFTYVARGKSMAMQYFEAPPEVFEEQEAMRTWVDKAYGTALKANRARRKIQT
ncbi:TfoX/Sxy family protein [Thiobacillus sp.]